MGALMKPLMQFGLCCLLAPGVFAQHHGGGALSGGRLGSVTSGYNAGRVHGSTRTFGYGRYGGYGYDGYGYGGFYGGYYEPFYDYGYNPPAGPGGSNVTVVYPPSAPPVMIAETAHPVIHEYTQQEDYGIPPERESHPILYLIAFRDSTIRAAMTYWVESGSLHYLDTDHKEKQAPLSSVDRDLSAQLNRERHIPFNIQ
jgi:hypothetical protein